MDSSVEKYIRDEEKDKSSGYSVGWMIGTFLLSISLLITLIVLGIYLYKYYELLEGKGAFITTSFKNAAVEAQKTLEAFAKKVDDVKALRYCPPALNTEPCACPVQEPKKTWASRWGPFSGLKKPGPTKPPVNLTSPVKPSA